MHVTEVGKLFISGKTSWPEGVWCEHTPTGPLLLFAYRNPSAKEIQAARTGKVELALYEDPPVLFILHRVEGLEGWADCPFSIRMYTEPAPLPEQIPDGSGLGLHIALIDAGTGILKAQRLVGTSTEFARALCAAVQRQLEAPFSEVAYHKRINQVYQELTTEQLLARAIARHMI